MIRKAVTGDLASIREIATEAFSPFVPIIGRKPAPMVADFAHQIAEGIVSVSVSGDRVLGYCVSYSRTGDWHVENLAVALQVKGQGVGRRLIDDAERQARDAGCEAVELYTNVAMLDTIAFYPRLGYQEIERAMQDGFERVFFRKVLT